MKRLRLILNGVFGIEIHDTVVEMALFCLLNEKIFILFLNDLIKFRQTNQIAFLNFLAVLLTVLNK